LVIDNFDFICLPNLEQLKQVLFGIDSLKTLAPDDFGVGVLNTVGIS